MIEDEIQEHRTRKIGSSVTHTKDDIPGTTSNSWLSAFVFDCPFSLFPTKFVLLTLFWAFGFLSVGFCAVARTKGRVD